MRTYLDVLLQILRALECLSTEITFVRFKRDVNSNVGSDMIALDCGSSALVPSTGQIEVIGTFAADMFLADMIL
jgi:hypothetical protein